MKRSATAIQEFVRCHTIEIFLFQSQRPSTMRNKFNRRVNATKIINMITRSILDRVARKIYRILKGKSLNVEKRNE